MWTQYIVLVLTVGISRQRCEDRCCWWIERGVCWWSTCPATGSCINWWPSLLHWGVLITYIPAVFFCTVTSCTATVRLKNFSLVLWHCWLGDRKGIWPLKTWVLVCWWWRFDWSFARLIALFATTTSILNNDKIENGDILVPANPGPPGKWMLNGESWASELKWCP